MEAPDGCWQWFRFTPRFGAFALEGVRLIGRGGQAVQHEAGHGEVKPALARLLAFLPILGQAAATIDPGEGAFDDPASGLDHEAPGALGTFDDLDGHPEHLGGPVDQLPGIAGVRPDEGDGRVGALQVGKEGIGSVPVLPTRRVHIGQEQQAVGVHREVTLAPDNPFVPVVAPTAPFSVTLTV